MSEFFGWLDWFLAEYELLLVGLYAIGVTIWAMRLWRKLDDTRRLLENHKRLNNALLDRCAELGGGIDSIL